uniref:Uncharacterized protein n=1 Tax=Spongospora subterranea TaxID=70186 RepID=A0A0H5QGF1_9EUKA|eukprot:CRZ00672.1 hypothetical protein [Spongospora subterranea]
MANRIPVLWRRPSYNIITWDDLSNAIVSNQLHVLGRSHEVQDTYREEMEAISKKFAFPFHYLLDRVFDVGLDVDSNTGLLIARRSQYENDVRFRKNDYPYHMETGIEHYILWAGSASALESATNTSNSMREFIPDHLHQCEMRYFVNPVNLQSVKEICHAHVFFRTT